jgi:glycosyltransferase involved in cell wall biosynthesis
MDPLPLSVLLLVRDEAARLADLLPRLAFASDVLVVVDAATRDSSRETAAQHGARVVERALDDFGRQRQFALEHCREEWVLWLDADERLDAAAQVAVEAAVRSPGVLAGYRLERRTWFLGKRIRHCGWGGERVLRLFRRSASSFDPAPVHESVRVDGPIGELGGAIEHSSYERWSDCRSKLVAYAARGAEKARGQGRRATPIDLLVRPPLRFVRMYLLQGGFLDGGHGLAVSALGATQVMLKYFDLWADPDGTGRSR